MAKGDRAEDKRPLKRGQDIAYRSKGDRIEVYLRPPGIRAKYQKALKAKGATMREDLQEHVERTIEESP